MSNLILNVKCLPIFFNLVCLPERIKNSIGYVISEEIKSPVNSTTEVTEFCSNLIVCR